MAWKRLRIIENEEKQPTQAERIANMCMFKIVFFQ